MLLLYHFPEEFISSTPGIFTFHYASTLSLWQLKNPVLLLNLHSTMLLLYRIWYIISVSGADQFTFHYASTLSNAPMIVCLNLFIFTFHYASTLSADCQNAFNAQQNLHSTMLLLYLYEHPNAICSYSFTFHYASTLSCSAGYRTECRTQFTFHYASTLSLLRRFIVHAGCIFTFHYASTLSSRML